MIIEFLRWITEPVLWATVHKLSKDLEELSSENDKLKLKTELLELENLSLSRQLETAIDTIQAFGLHNRAIGAEAKTYTDFLASKDK